MNAFYLLPFAIGIVGVLQGALNGRLSQQWGLGWTVLWNTITILVLSTIVVALGIFPGKINLAAFKWWHLLPGLFGFLFVLFIPLSISRIGALNSFLILISSQLLVSGAWDKFVEGVDVSWTRALGACLALIGTWLASR